MGSGDYEAEVKNSLRDIQSRVEALTKAQGRLNGEMRRYGDEARGAFRGHGGMHEASEDAGKFGESIKELGHAVRGVGGTIGEIVHRLTGGAGMGGALGLVATAAGLANLAMERFNEAVEKNLEHAHNAAEANEKLARAIERADDVAKKGAADGLGGAKDRRKLLAAGGEYAVNDAEFVAANGDVSPQDAAAGVASAYGKHHLSDRTAATIQSAQRLAQTGIPFAEGVNLLLAHGGDLTSAKNARRIEATVFNRYTGSRNNDDYNYGAALAATGSGQDGLIDAAAGVGRQRNATRLRNEGRAVERADFDARGANAADANPLVDAILKLHQTSEQQLQVLRDQLAAANRGVRESDVHGNVGDIAAARWAARKARQALDAATRSAAESSPGVPYGPGG